MIKFLFKVWALAKPYRARMFLGVICGMVSGLMSLLLIGTIMFVYSAVFLTSDPRRNRAIDDTQIAAVTPGNG